MLHWKTWTFWTVAGVGLAIALDWVYTIHHSPALIPLGQTSDSASLYLVREPADAPDAWLASLPPDDLPPSTVTVVWTEPAVPLWVEGAVETKTQVAPRRPDQPFPDPASVSLGTGEPTPALVCPDASRFHNQDTVGLPALLLKHWSTLTVLGFSVDH